VADGQFHSTARKLKCDGTKPICANCDRRKAQQLRERPGNQPPDPPCRFDLFPRRRGPAKHKQLKLDAESESSWPPLTVVPRTRARAAAEAKILTHPPVVGAGRGASTGVSEASFAGGSVAHPSAMSILFGGEIAMPASPAAESTRESTPSADGEENEQIEEPGASKEKQGEEEEAQEDEDEDEDEEEDENLRVENGEEREVMPKEKEKAKVDELCKEQKEAKVKMDGDEGRVDIIKEVTLESSPPHRLLGRHT
jgi:hypothetical protein